MKKFAILLLVLALSLGCLAAAFAQAEGGTPPLMGTVTGIVVEVKPYTQQDGTDVEHKRYVLVKSEDGNLTNFLVNEETCHIIGRKLDEIRSGDIMIGTYDMTQPVLMIYPPQYVAASVTIQE